MRKAASRAVGRGRVLGAGGAKHAHAPMHKEMHPSRIAQWLDDEAPRSLISWQIGSP